MCIHIYLCIHMCVYIYFISSNSLSAYSVWDLNSLMPSVVIVFFIVLCCVPCVSYWTHVHTHSFPRSSLSKFWSLLWPTVPCSYLRIALSALFLLGCVWASSRSPFIYCFWLRGWPALHSLWQWGDEGKVFSSVVDGGAELLWGWDQDLHKSDEDFPLKSEECAAILQPNHGGWSEQSAGTKANR